MTLGAVGVAACADWSNTRVAVLGADGVSFSGSAAGEGSTALLTGLLVAGAVAGLAALAIGDRGQRAVTPPVAGFAVALAVLAVLAVDDASLSGGELAARILAAVLAGAAGAAMGPPDRLVLTVAAGVLVGIACDDQLTHFTGGGSLIATLAATDDLGGLFSRRIAEAAACVVPAIAALALAQWRAPARPGGLAIGALATAGAGVLVGVGVRTHHLDSGLQHLSGSWPALVALAALAVAALRQPAPSARLTPPAG